MNKISIYLRAEKHLRRDHQNVLNQASQDSMYSVLSRCTFIIYEQSCIKSSLKEISKLSLLRILKCIFAFNYYYHGGHLLIPAYLDGFSPDILSIFRLTIPAGVYLHLFCQSFRIRLANFTMFCGETAYCEIYANQ